MVKVVSVIVLLVVVAFDRLNALHMCLSYPRVRYVNIFIHNSI